MNAVASSAGVAPKKPSRALTVHDLSCAAIHAREAVEHLRLVRLYVKDNTQAMAAVNAAGDAAMQFKKVIDAYYAKGSMPA
jgi:hypothetical protein